MATPISSQYVSEEQLRAEAIRELGIEDLSPDAQNEIMSIVRGTLFEYINIAVMKALGPEGMMALAELEEQPEEFAKEMLKRLPNVGDIVKGAIDEGLNKHRESVSKVRTRFGLPAVSSGT